MRPLTSDNSPSRSLAVADPVPLPAAFGPELEEAARYVSAEKAEATRRAWAAFTETCFSLFGIWFEVG
jgi:hypothetical protein